MAVLDRAVKEGLPEEGASKKASGTEGTSHAYIQGKCIPGRGNSHCKGPETGLYLACLSSRPLWQEQSVEGESGKTQTGK